MQSADKTSGRISPETQWKIIVFEGEKWTVRGLFLHGKKAVSYPPEREPRPEETARVRSP